MGVTKRARGSIASGVAGAVLAGVAYASFQPGNADTVVQFEDADQVARQLPAAVEGFDGKFPGEAAPAPAGVARTASDNAAAAAIDRLRARLDRYLEADPEARPENGGQFEHGYAASLVLTDWMCSWEGVFLEARHRGDKSSATEALAQLATVYDLEYTKRYVYDPTRGWEKEVLKPARRGNVRAITQEYKSTCSGGGKS